jgi:putative methyltransferase (TIGR04325 family)
MNNTVPIVLFAHARPRQLSQALEGLRVNNVQLIYAFSDGARNPSEQDAVDRVRSLLHAVDWCDMRITERDENLGLGRSILAGVSRVLEEYDAAIVIEDDLVCVPGTYAYLVAALRHYAGDPRVMSVTAWTHPRVIPGDVQGRPYFDGRTDCWVWGTWRRAWNGMDQPAASLMRRCRRRGIDVYRYGADLPDMARHEGLRNIWAVRFAYLHLLHGGLCLRPGCSLVQNVGFGVGATNTSGEGEWAGNTVAARAIMPGVWPEPGEHPDCRQLWQRVYGGRADAARAGRAARVRTCKRVAGLLLPPLIKSAICRALPRRRLEPAYGDGVHGWFGDYPTWAAAEAESSGYNQERIFDVVRRAVCEVRDGKAACERDGVVFDHVQYSWPVIASLMAVAARESGVLNVLDFGGALGSVYWQARRFLQGLDSVRWSVVEQGGFVECGRREFENATIRFYDSIAACMAETRPNVILLSGVLQYVPEPWSLLEDITSLHVPYLLLDRTTCSTNGRNRLTVQNVPASIYKASYPCRLFDEAHLLSHLEDRYSLIEAFDAIDGRFPDVYFRGFFLEQKQDSKAQ